MIDDKEFDFVSQNSHILGGAVAVYAPAALVSFRAALYGAVLVAIFAAIKEAWYDEVYETAEVRGSGWRDFIHYVYGIAFALASLWASSHWKVFFPFAP